MSGQFPHFHESHGQNDDRVQHARSIDRSFSKQLFREMAKTEMEDAPLNWRQRKRFVAFATRLGIDEFEAKLILRAVEYECGHAELAALDERQERAHEMTRWIDQFDGSASDDSSSVWLAVSMVVVLMGLRVILLF